jgi:N6-adenosine-specific RNA methylase IME4
MKHIGLLLFYLNIALLVQSCAMFKKTTKQTVKESQNTEKRYDYNLLTFKSANKETNIYTYWDNGMVYQYQNIRELTNETASVGIKTTEKASAKKDTVIKESKPAVLWVYTGIGILIIGTTMLYRRLVMR